MTIFIFFGRIQTDWRDVGIMVSHQIKRKRVGNQKEEEKLHPFLLPFSSIPKIMLLFVLFISFSIDM
jgi:hypothetical protein